MYPKVGRRWVGLTRGLPEENAFKAIYRGALCTDTLDLADVYFGMNTGQLYASADEGDTWTLVTQNLPPISSVSAACVG